MHLSGPIIATYQELLQRHFRRPPVSVEGSLMLTQRGGSSVWVARKRRGKKVGEIYLGVDNEETRAKVDTARQEQITTKEWSQGCTTLVAALRASGCAATDTTSARVLGALREIGFFDQKGLVSGVQAFNQYPLMFGRLNPECTQKALLSLVSTACGNEVVSHLVAQGIDLKPSAGEGSDHGRKWIAEGKIEVEFVHVEGEETFLLENRKNAVALYRSGVLVSIPDPARYALHCLLASDQGCWSQAEWLIGVISDECPFDLYRAYKELYAGWPDSIQKLEATLNFMPESSMILDEILDIFE